MDADHTVVWVDPSAFEASYDVWSGIEVHVVVEPLHIPERSQPVLREDHAFGTHLLHELNYKYDRPLAQGVSVSDEGRNSKSRGSRKVDDARTNAIRDATPGVQSPAQVKEMGGVKANRKKVGAGTDDEHQ